jgi:sec-independent protein translocase protein TatB
LAKIALSNKGGKNMFGMSFAEIMIIAVIAVLFLGPEKLPAAMVQIAKFFKTFKSGINDAKASFEQEIKLEELKEETKAYKKKLEEAQTSIRKTVTFDELNEIKKSTQSVNDTFKEIEQSVTKAKTAATNPTKLVTDEIMKPKETKKSES